MFCGEVLFQVLTRNEIQEIQLVQQINVFKGFIRCQNTAQQFVILTDRIKIVNWKLTVDIINCVLMYISQWKFHEWILQRTSNFQTYRRMTMTNVMMENIFPLFGFGSIWLGLVCLNTLASVKGTLCLYRYKRLTLS